MKILAIESSCDETAAAVVEGGGDFSAARVGKIAEMGNVRVLSNVVVSQIDIFAEYGGVIPEVAARSHLEAILPVIHKAMDDAGVGEDEIDTIAVTHTPGLLGSLLIGTLTARVLAILWGKPLYAVHHLKSHIYANWLESERESSTLSQSEVNLLKSNPSLSSGRDFERVQPKESSSMVSKEQMIRDTSASRLTNLPEFPLVALVVSGGHTQIIYMAGHNEFEIIGTTRDDAVGECFDKVAKILGLPYPGGPSIARAALSSTITSSKTPVRGGSTLSTASLRTSSSPSTSSKITSARRISAEKQWYDEHPNYRLPHPKVEGLDFSFSGLKTAVLRAVQAELGVPINTPSHELAGKLTEQQKANFAAVFQETAVEILIDKLKMALEAHPEARTVVIAGGVSANKVLRERALMELSGGFNGKIQVGFPEITYAGDNAAMVGVAAYYEIISGVAPTDPYKLNIAPRSPIYS